MSDLPDFLKLVGEAVNAWRRKNPKSLWSILTLIAGAIAAYLTTISKNSSFVFWAEIAAIVAGAIFLGLLVRALLKTPPTVDEQKTTKAIKGLFPFTESQEDGELFTKLGPAGINTWSQQAMDTDLPVVVLKGKAGSGKTSALRAGLHYQLKEKANICYWQATAESTIEDLEHAVRTIFGIQAGKDWLKAPEDEQSHTTKTHIVMI